MAPFEMARLDVTSAGTTETPPLLDYSVLTLESFSDLLLLVESLEDC